MKKRIQAKLKSLPTTPGVYFYKDTQGEIIYIGKAANLRSRVNQYFQPSRPRDAKTDALVAEITDIAWQELETEVDALFLEAELVKRYLPRYNILLRDDKASLFVRINYNSNYPTVNLVRRPLDDGARYFGPYINGWGLKKALKFLRRAFPYATGQLAPGKRVNLHYHLGLDPGLEEGRTSLTQYRANLRKLMHYLRGHKASIFKEIEREMKSAARASQFEKAARARDQLRVLESLNRQVIFSDRERLDLSKDEALQQLAKLLLIDPPGRIEGFDVSHLQGTDNVASMCVFTSGLPDKAAYRKFKLRLPGNDDFAHLHEALTRRFGAKNRHSWGLPDLVLIDGGKGQLAAAIAARDESGLNGLPMIGLAKRLEEIIIPKIEISNQQLAAKKRVTNYKILVAQAEKIGGYVRDDGNFLVVSLPLNSPLVKLLQRIRDESHRFAIGYHSLLHRRRQTSSPFEQVPSLGPQTRKKLVRRFGSLKAASAASEAELQTVLGTRRGAAMAAHFKKASTQIT